MKRKKKAAEDIRQQEKLINIANMELNDKIKNLVPYEPISGTYEIRLDANECPENLPGEIRAQLREKLDEISFNRYPDPLAAKLVNSFAE